MQQFFMGKDALIIPARSEVEARNLLLKQYDRWATLASEFCMPRAFIRFPGCKENGLEIRAASRVNAVYQGQLMSITNFHSSHMPLSPGVLKALETIAGNPSEQYFLHLMKNDCDNTTQIAVTESCQSLIVGATPSQAIGRKRSDYTHPEDLPTMIAHFRSLSVGGQPREKGYRLFSPVFGADSDTWRQSVYSYQIVDETQSGVILLSRCISVAPIARPVIAR